MAYVAKLDWHGWLQWSKTFDPETADASDAISQMPDGGYLVTGTNRHGICVIRTDSLGNIRWNRTLDPNIGFAALSAVPTSDNGFIAVNRESLAKYDTAGLCQWKDGRPSWSMMRALRFDHSLVQPIQNAGCIVQTGDFRYARRDASGRWVWNHGLIGGDSAVGLSIRETRDRGFIVSGYIQSDSIASDSGDICLVKLDSFGRLRWKKSYADSGFSYGLCAVPDGETGYLVAGVRHVPGDSLGKGQVIWFDSVGRLLSVTTMKKPSDARYISATADAGHLIVGTVKLQGRERLYLMKYGHEQRRRSYQ